METRILKRPYRLWVHIIIYSILSIMLLGGCFAVVKSYEKFQQIIIEPTSPLTTQKLMEVAPLDTTEAGISQSLTDEQLSQLFFNKLQYDLLPSGSDVSLEAYYYDTQEEVSYMNFTDGEQIYSLVAHTEIDEINDKIHISFSNFKFGKYKIGLLGSYYTYKFEINKRVEMDFNESEQLIYINSMTLDKGQVTCHYTYNMPIVMKNFQSYKNNLDSNKVAIYAKEDAKVEEFVNTIKEISGFAEEGVKTWFSRLRTDRQLLEKCALTLNDEGIRELCSNFQMFYNNSLQPERLIEVSQNELNYALMQYHNSFSKMVLSYLYIHKDYYYMGDQLMVGNVPIDAQNILNENGKQALYGVELISDHEGISAYYNTGGVDTQKLILRKE